MQKWVHIPEYHFFSIFSETLGQPREVKKKPNHVEIRHTCRLDEYLSSFLGPWGHFTALIKAKSFRALALAYNHGLKIWEKWEISDNFGKPQATGKCFSIVYKFYKLKFISEIYPGALSLFGKCQYFQSLIVVQRHIDPEVLKD